MKNKKIIQKIILAGIVINKNKVLILQRNKDEHTFPNIWELPSGKREVFEQSEQGLLREIKEETGIEDVHIIQPLSIFDYIVEKEKEIRDSTQINFLVECKKDVVPILSSEHQNFAWVSESDLNKFNLTNATKLVIKEAFKKLKI